MAKDINSVALRIRRAVLGEMDGGSYCQRLSLIWLTVDVFGVLLINAAAFDLAGFLHPLELGVGKGSN